METNDINELNEIIKKCTLIDLRKREPLPKEAYIVGMSNDYYDCRHFYNMEHTTHMRDKNTYGGYTSEDERCWWTMNHNFCDFRNEFMFIVPDRDSGEKLADLLNTIGNDWMNYIKAIDIRKEKIEKLQEEINVIKGTKDALFEKVKEICPGEIFKAY